MFAGQVAVSLVNAQKYERALQTKGDLETLINIAPVGVIVFDARTGGLIAHNREAERIVGDVGLPGNSWEEALQVLTFRRADGREISLSDLPLVRVLRSGETVRAEEILIYLPDGTAVNTLVNAAPIYSEQGEITSVVVVLQDVSPIEEMDRMRSDFLSLVSNELRAPLTTIKDSLSALAGIDSPAEFVETRQLLRAIDLQTDLMRSQIDSLIDLTRIENGTLAISSGSEELGPLLEEARRGFLRNNAGHNLEFSAGENLPPVMMDRQRVAQVLQTLLNCGVKCSPPSSTLKVEARREHLHVAITVSLDGQVIPAPELDDILQGPTLSVFRDFNGREKGGQLALAICQGIVNAHGGRLWADCGPSDQGMSLGFSLPVAEESGGAAEDSTAGGAQQSRPAEARQASHSVGDGQPPDAGGGPARPHPCRLFSHRGPGVLRPGRPHFQGKASPGPPGPGQATLAGLRNHSQRGPVPRFAHHRPFRPGGRRQHSPGLRAGGR